jgi:hypothetical protein
MFECHSRRKSTVPDWTNDPEKVPPLLFDRKGQRVGGSAIGVQTISTLFRRPVPCQSKASGGTPFPWSADVFLPEMLSAGGRLRKTRLTIVVCG